MNQILGFCVRFFHMIEVEGHRGARGHAPENTLPSFAAAVEAGVDWIELDLGVSRDRELIVAHDFFLSPAIHTWKDGRKIMPMATPLHSLSREELRGLDCGAKLDPKFPQQVASPGAAMPSLADLVRFMDLLPAAKKIRLNLELKSLPAGDGLLHPKPRDFAKLVWRNLNDLGLLSRIVVQSFDHRLVAELRRLGPRLPLSLLFGENATDYALLAGRAKVKEVSVNQYWLGANEARELRRKKIRIRAWTANEERDWERLVDLKVSTIITDYPAELAAFLRKKRLR